MTKTTTSEAREPRAEPLRSAARERTRGDGRPTAAAGSAPVKAYEPTAEERETILAYFSRRKAAPGIKVDDDRGVATVGIDHPDQTTGTLLLAAAVGDRDGQFLPSLLNGLCQATANKGKVDRAQLNFALSVVKGIEPRDPLETMLAAQMAVTHNAILTFARRLNHVDTIPQQDSAERALNKLARTYTMQLEALKKYRSGGEQTVRVEHVTVNEGGQAIVGNVTTGGPGSRSKEKATP